jgi:3-oxoadipate enol-lactonase
MQKGNFFTNSDQLSMYYEEHGQKDSQNVIFFLNGLSQSTLAWVLMVPHFRENSRIILLDFIFQGQSDKRGEWRDFDRHAKDIKELADYLKISQAHFVGLSYGSLVAQHFALLYPEFLKKLVLMSTFAHKTPYYDAIESSWWKALETGGWPLMLEVMLPTVLGEQYFSTPLIPIEMMKQARSEANDAASIFKLMRATKERPDYREKIKMIKSPTLVVHGEKDLLFPKHLGITVHQQIPGSKMEIIPGVGHTLNLEAVPQCNSILEKFIFA